jgi:hypothetical protein
VLYQAEPLPDVVLRRRSEETTPKLYIAGLRDLE